MFKTIALLRGALGVLNVERLMNWYDLSQGLAVCVQSSGIRLSFIKVGLLGEFGPDIYTSTKRTRECESHQSGQATQRYMNFGGDN